MTHYARGGLHGPAAAEEVDVRDGEVFAGRYEVRGVLGQGAMGTVYRAVDQRFEREVALKLMAAHLGQDPGFRRRFQREAATGGRIQHENVVFVIDASEHDGVLYVVMQLVPGTDLAQLLAVQGRLSPARAGRLLRDVAQGLDAAHEIGVVHRDVKPANVLVTGGQGPRERALLTDFGLTTARTDASQRSSGVFVLGTPAYMAPEQVRGEQVDRRADVYALGCVAYECLAGRLPFAQVDPGAQAYAKLEQAAPELREAWPDAPAELAAVVARALERDPGLRQATAGELGRALLATTADAGGSSTTTTTMIPLGRADEALTSVLPLPAATRVHEPVPQQTDTEQQTRVQQQTRSEQQTRAEPAGDEQPASAAPPPRARRRRPVRALVASTALVGAVLAGATLLGLPPAENGSDAGASTGGTPGAPPRLPAAVAQDCRAQPPSGPRTAAYTCTAAAGSGADEFLVYQWPDTQAMQADFQEHYDAGGSGRYPDGTCAKRWEVSSTWRAGDLACYRNTRGAAVLMFEYEQEAVQVLAVRKDGQRRALYDWWVRTRIDLQPG